MGVLIGSQIDGKDKKILPYCIALFLFRGVGLVTMTTIVTDFKTQMPLLMACFIAMTSGTFCQTIVCQSLMNKRLVAPIKEIKWSRTGFQSNRRADSDRSGRHSVK